MLLQDASLRLQKEDHRERGKVLGMVPRNAGGVCVSLVIKDDQSSKASIGSVFRLLGEPAVAPADSSKEFGAYRNLMQKRTDLKYLFT